MRRLLGILFAAWALSPSGAGACGLSGSWYVSSDDGYTGIFIIEKVIDDASCEARLSVFSPVGESAVELCRVLRSDKVVIYCEIISASFFFKAPDNFILEEQGEVLKGRWISDISATLSSQNSSSSAALEVTSGSHRRGAHASNRHNRFTQAGRRFFVET